jgi:hypothetical protein
MMIHMFVFRWKPGSTAADRARAAQEIRAFRSVVPGLIEVHVGANRSLYGGGYGTAGVMTFVDGEALKDYFGHPAHQKLLLWLVPLIDAIEADFES